MVQRRHRTAPRAVRVSLIVTALAVWWAWEYLLVLSPVAVPAWMQPALVAGCAAGAVHLPLALLTAAAAAGLVALLHRISAAPDTPRLVVRRRTGRLPPV